MARDRLYVGLRIPDEVRSIADDKGPELAISSWLEARELAGELPGGVDVREVRSRPDPGDGAGFGRYIYVRCEGAWQPVPTLCTDRLDLIHNDRGQHEWGYGGHGPNDTALSLIADFTGAPREALMRPSLGVVVDFLAHLRREEEWSVSARQLAKAMDALPETLPLPPSRSAVSRALSRIRFA